MKYRRTLLAATSLAIAGAQPVSKAVVSNLSTANWTREKGASDDSQGVLLRTDEANGGMDLLVRFPAGHVIPPHFHDSNERLIVVEGQVTRHEDSGDAHIDSGGYAFLPAHEVQRLACTSKTRCTFYLIWDGKPDSHPVK